MVGDSFLVIEILGHHLVGLKQHGGFVAGLGGRDIWEQTVENVIDKAEELGAKQEPCEAPIWIDLKEEEVVYNA